MIFPSKTSFSLNHPHCHLVQEAGLLERFFKKEVKLQVLREHIFSMFLPYKAAKREKKLQNTYVFSMANKNYLLLL